MDERDREVTVYRPYILGVVRAYVRNVQDAEDVAQAAAVEAWCCWHTCRDPQARRAWLAQIAFHQAAKLHRERRRQERWGCRPVPLELAEGVAVDPALLPEGVPLAYFAALPEEQAAALLLFLAGYEQQEIAARQGVPVTTVKKRIFCARTRLRRRARLECRAAQTGGVT